MVEMQLSTQLESHQQPQILEPFEIYRLDELELLEYRTLGDWVFQQLLHYSHHLLHKLATDEADDDLEAILDELESPELIHNMYEIWLILNLYKSISCFEYLQSQQYNTHVLVVEVEVEVEVYDKVEEVEVGETVDDAYSYQQEQSSIIILYR